MKVKKILLNFVLSLRKFLKDLCGGFYASDTHSFERRYDSKTSVQQQTYLCTKSTTSMCLEEDIHI